MYTIYFVWAMCLLGALGGGVLGYFFGFVSGGWRYRELVSELDQALLQQQAQTQQARRSVAITAIASERMDADMAEDLTHVVMGRYETVQTAVKTPNPDGLGTSITWGTARVHKQGLWRKQRFAHLKDQPIQALPLHQGDGA